MKGSRRSIKGWTKAASPIASGAACYKYNILSSGYINDGFCGTTVAKSNRNLVAALDVMLPGKIL
jgi:hypothetical protein